MPSPFPGMDPYLESPDWFPNLHHDLIFCIKEMLQSRLPSSYYVQSNQRVWLEYSRRYVEPDAEVVHSRPTRRKRGRGGLAVAEPHPAEPLVISVETVEHGPFQESFVEIRQRRGREVRLVTSLEVLGPSNKTPGNPGREQYLNKQREVTSGEVHLVEIDLLRGGTHTSAVPRELAEARAGRFDYHVSVHRFDQPKNFLLYPILFVAFVTFREHPFPIERRCCRKATPRSRSSRCRM
ncbi:MAG: DUF4058 family protein [Isosphaeraceae bacterium]